MVGGDFREVPDDDGVDQAHPTALQILGKRQHMLYPWPGDDACAELDLN